MGEAPQPKSPPRYPDLCGRRRLQLEVQILNREVGFLEVRTTPIAFLPSFSMVASRACVAVRHFARRALYSMSPSSILHPVRGLRLWEERRGRVAHRVA
jgi:hypothetical protein